jgi:drug/metabolite transporter (DMT)-like permease
LIYLLLSIASSTVIFVVFKLFDRFKIDRLQGIVVNYVVACICGLIATQRSLPLQEIPDRQWFPYALVLGLLFITIFNLMAITTQRSGLSVVSVATKMSVVIPVLFGLVYYRESASFIKLTGITLAVVAVYLASIKSKEGLRIARSNLIFPLLVFLGSGIIDSSIKYLEESYVAEDEVPLFSATIFAAAGLLGLFGMAFARIRGRLRLQLRSIVGGVALGIPNYFSIYFLVLALRSEILESSGIFTVNNVAIVMVSTLIGIILFGERLTMKNWVGVALAVISICLIALA